MRLEPSRLTPRRSPAPIHNRVSFSQLQKSRRVASYLLWANCGRTSPHQKALSAEPASGATKIAIGS